MTTPTEGRNLVIVLSIVATVVANVVELLVCVAGKVGWTLVAFLAVMLDRGERRGEMEETHSETSLDDVSEQCGRA